MKSLILFAVVVFLGVFGVIVLSNQEQKKILPASDIKFDLSPTSAAVPLKETDINPTFPPFKPSPTILPTAIPTVFPTGSTNPQSTKAAMAIIKTSKGNITLSLFGDDAPGTVANFTGKAQSGFYNNLIFHRVEDWVVQGGDPQGNGQGGGNMPVEFNNRPFVIGSLGVASRGDGKIQNDAQFFITKKDASWLNGQYTNFGQVTDGMDVVNKLEIGDKILEILLQNQ